jgi:uncharacterized protein
MPASLPEINELDSALHRVDANMGASEAHGTLCGMLCARGTVELSVWMEHVAGEQMPGNIYLHELVDQLSVLHQSTMEQINDSLTEFSLLLPDDEEPLSERVMSLASWCQGFVYGLAAGGIHQGSELPHDSNELLRDMIEISRAAHDEDTADEDDSDFEEDEVAYMEIHEYVRAGTLLIYEELQPLQSTRTLH